MRFRHRVRSGITNAKAAGTQPRPIGGQKGAIALIEARGTPIDALILPVSLSLSRITCAIFYSIEMRKNL
jgi:hypothetical protein